LLFACDSSIHISGIYAIDLYYYAIKFISHKLESARISSFGCVNKYAGNWSKIADEINANLF